MVQDLLSIAPELDRPIKPTTSGRGKLTTFFAGEEFRLSYFYSMARINLSFISTGKIFLFRVVKRNRLGLVSKTGLAWSNCPAFARN
jgi:hypothetical protein